jgi:hypothetical protein
MLNARTANPASAARSRNVASISWPPPHEQGDRHEVRELGQQLVGVDQERVRGAEHGDDRERHRASGSPADDAVHEHEPRAQQRDLDELQAVVVETPEVDERRQQEGPAPRVADRAEAVVRVEHREPVVGDDLMGVAVEDAARLAEVQREVVALRVPVAVERDRGDRRDQHQTAEGERPSQAGVGGEAARHGALTLGGAIGRCSFTRRLT